MASFGMPPAPGSIRLFVQAGDEKRARWLPGEAVRVVSEEPYLTGEVEFLSSTPADDSKAKELSDDAGSLFAEYVRLYLAMSNQWARSVEMPGEPDGLADFIGARLGVAPQVKQR